MQHLYRLLLFSHHIQSIRMMSPQQYHNVYKISELELVHLNHLHMYPYFCYSYPRSIFETRPHHFSFSGCVSDSIGIQRVKIVSNQLFLVFQLSFHNYLRVPNLLQEFGLEVEYIHKFVPDKCRSFV